MLVKIKQNAKDFNGIEEEGGEFGVELALIDDNKIIIDSYLITFFKTEEERNTYFNEIDSDYLDYEKAIAEAPTNFLDISSYTVENYANKMYLNLDDGKIYNYSDNSEVKNINTLKDIYAYILKNDLVTITKDNIHLYYEFLSSSEKLKYCFIINSVTDKRFLEVIKDLNVDMKSIINFTLEQKVSYTLFGIKDILKPIDEYIEEIKESIEYKEYIKSRVEISPIVQSIIDHLSCD